MIHIVVPVELHEIVDRDHFLARDVQWSLLVQIVFSGILVEEEAEERRVPLQYEPDAILLPVLLDPIEVDEDALFRRLASASLASVGD